jgi:probable F420-dependent oxidoreductase
MLKVDSYYPAGVPLSEVGTVARQAEDAGFDALWAAETGHNPFLACGSALSATQEITVGTGIAVAFPRSPMVTAQASWDLAELGRGRFVLGLGTQVKAHVVRRFSAPFDRPVARMREYVHALRAIFDAFQGNGRLKFSGDLYNFSLLTEFFSPGPIEHPDIPIWLAAVGPAMLRLAGECCDGAFLHPLNSAEYLRATVLPMVEAGATAADRTRADVTLCCPVFVAAGDTPEEIAGQRASIARQIAFYGSTRTYRPVFETHGWGDVTDTLHGRLARGDTDGMTAAITDDMLDVFCVTATWDGLPAALTGRYGSLVDRIAPYGIDLRAPGVAEHWRDVIARIRAGS